MEWALASRPSFPKADDDHDPQEQRARPSRPGLGRSAHTFSFGGYFAIAHQGHGSLYVLNEDAIAPARGFPMDGHRPLPPDVVPAKHQGCPPAYEQKHFPEQDRRARLALVVSPAGVDGSLGMNADVCIETGLFDGLEHCEKQFDAARLACVHLARGELLGNGQRLAAGDGALLEAERTLSLAGGRGAEILVFDLAR